VALCVFIITDTSWLNNDVEKAWKRRFLASIFHHFAISDKRGIKILLNLVAHIL
jgi:hypothetical protein